ncbi:MAG: hypothetical protein A3G38_02195 [Omnitrophica WOR_2 bacterium RIFCSPLOWO2_12_FULL_51_8]|nr:MAG: hypothetical protein A3G38_02195 [Omnitrophica WOR_2 bacterium RIFCSPLOWO2_12_FULL_51_8]
MLHDIVSKINWVDLFVIIILLRILYIASENGLPVEFFKFLGTVFSLYLSLHYYSAAGTFLQERLYLKIVPKDFLDFVVFALLAIAGYLIFVILRNLFSKNIVMEAAPNLNRWGGFLLGLFRSLLILGVLTFTLLLCNINYLKQSVIDSYFASRIVRIAPAAYGLIWNNITSKFISHEKFNQAVDQVLSSNPVPD